MKTIRYLFILLFCTVLLAGCSNNPDVAPGNSAATTVIEYTLSDEEQAVIDEINFARTEPKEYVTQRLSPSVLDVSKKSESYIAALEELTDRMLRMEAVPGLTPASGLNKCSAEWVKISGPEGYVGHEKTIASRFKKYCTYVSFAENCSYGYSTGKDIVIALLIDDGVEDRGHRNNILNPAYKNIGAAIGPHKKYGTMCCIDFAYGYQEK